MSKKNILFLNFGGIGDEILFLPTIESVKNIYPDSKIALALEPRSKCIKELTNLIDEIIEFDIKNKNKPLNTINFLKTIWAKNFDIVISSGSSFFVGILLFLTGIKERYGYNSNFLNKILLTKSIDLNKNQYAANMYNDLVLPLGNFEYKPPKINIEPPKEDFVLIHPGVSNLSIQKGIYKSPPAQAWAEIIKAASTKHNVILSGGPDDKGIISEIVQILKKEGFDSYENRYGKTKNITELAKLINSAKCFICVDSAPMHIAVGLNKNIIAIFGPTDENKLLPKKENFKVIKANIGCRPCLWDKRSKNCEASNCLKINISQILKELEQFSVKKNVY